MTWLVAHKHLVLALLAAVSIYALVAKIQAHFDGVAHDQRVIAEQQVQADLQKAKLEAAQSAKDKVDLQNQLNALAVSNAQMQSSLLALRTQLQSQQTKDAALPPADLAVRWSGLIGVLPGEFKAQGDGILASLTAAHTTVAKLEENPELHAEIAERDKNSAIKDTTITKLGTVIGDRETELATCRQTLTDQDTLCKKTVAEVKAQARKGKWKAFFAGVGVALGAILGIKR